MFGLLSAALPIIGDVVKKLIPDEEAQAKAMLELQKMQQEGELKELETRMSAILAEAQSKDPWTSRARPSFLYMCYALILSAIPMGVIAAISPDTATAIINGFKSWLNAIPSDLYSLMAVGYLGYSGARTFDKHSMNKHNRP